MKLQLWQLIVEFLAALKKVRRLLPIQLWSVVVDPSFVDCYIRMESFFYSEIARNIF